MIILVLLAVLLPFFLKGPDKQALIQAHKIQLPDIDLIKKKPTDDRQVPIAKGAKAGKKKNLIYRWKDKHGVIHFTDYPNPDGPSEKIKGVPLQSASPSPKKITQSKKESETDGIPTLPFPMSLSPSRVKKLKEDAEKIREVLQQRYDDMSQVQDK